MGRKLLYASASDWHCAPGAWGKMPAIRGDALYGLKQVVDFCIQNRIPLVGAGDLFDVERPDSRTLEDVFEQMARTNKAGFAVLYVRGQHDGKNNPPFLGLHHWPSHIDKKLLQSDVYWVEGCPIYGLDHTPGDSLKEELDKIPPETRILVCHQVWSQFMGFGVEGSLADIPHATVVLTGDLHQHKRISLVGATGQTMTVLSSGALAMQEITEPREHFFWAAYDDDTFESVKLKSRQVWDIEINNDEDLETFLTQDLDKVIPPQQDVPEEIAMNIVYITFQTNIKDAYRRMHKALAGKVHLFWKPVRPDDQVIIYADSEREKLIHQGLEGCLQLATDPAGPAYASVLRLLRAKDSKAELSTMESDFMKG